jgi:[CysO sulfur-carrier protein]-S-L-cysteine hydrolase
VLRLPRPLLDSIVAHAISAPVTPAGLVEEVCGFLVGNPGNTPGDSPGNSTGTDPDRTVHRYVPLDNVARSARVYAVDPGAHLRIERAAERDGAEIIGVVHSHTHTDAYPSPTDVAQVADPSWSYVIVSLVHGEASVRSYVLADGNIREEPVVLV